MREIFQQIIMISLYSSALAVLLLLVRLLIGSKMNRVATTLLWGLFLLRLILPFKIESPASVMNLLPSGITQTSSQAEKTNFVYNSFSPEASAVLPADLYNGLSEPPSNEKADIVLNNADKSGSEALKPVDIWNIASMLWCMGVVLLLVLISLANIGFLRRLKKKQCYREVGFLTLLEQCRKELNIKRNIEVVRMDEIGTAGICGIFKPRILVCPKAFDRLDRQAQKHILLHELMHVKRMDTVLSLMVVLLKAVYWFNPLIWVMFALMQSDIEILCDASVIKKLRQGENINYAGTLLNIAEHKRKSIRLVMAVADKTSQVKRRILKAIEWKKHRPIYTLIAVLLVLVAAVAGCTAPVPQLSVISNSSMQTVEEKTAQESAVPDESPSLPVITTGAAKSLTPAPQVIIADATVAVKNAPEPRIFNINKAIQLLNNQTIKPSGTLSLNALLGDRTEAKGWKLAPGIEKGQLTGLIGNGVCDVASALYMASLCADLEIADVTHHALPNVNVPLGLDATISSGAPDLVIKNNKNSDITIKTNVSLKDNDTEVKVEIDGEPLPDNMKIQLKTEIISKTKEKTTVAVAKEYYQDGKLIKRVLLENVVYRMLDAVKK